MNAQTWLDETPEGDAMKQRRAKARIETYTPTLYLAMRAQAAPFVQGSLFGNIDAPPAECAHRFDASEQQRFDGSRDRICTLCQKSFRCSQFDTTHSRVANLS